MSPPGILGAPPCLRGLTSRQVPSCILRSVKPLPSARERPRDCLEPLAMHCRGILQRSDPTRRMQQLHVKPEAALIL